MNNRETWLNNITAQYIRPHFQKAGYTIPENVRMSCAFTSHGSKGNRIGECWTDNASGDNTFEIFITPKIADSLRVVDILIHELCHATVGIKAGHKKPFANCAKAVGLTGKMTATIATDELKATIATWVQALGDYPHATLSSNGVRKQSTRLLKCECVKCGYTVRLSKKWIQVALPRCPDQDCDHYDYDMSPQDTDTDTDE